MILIDSIIDNDVYFLLDGMQEVKIDLRNRSFEADKLLNSDQKKFVIGMLGRKLNVVSNVDSYSTPVNHYHLDFAKRELYADFKKHSSYEEFELYLLNRIVEMEKEMNVAKR